jgi:hypothetical protein
MSTFPTTQNAKGLKDFLTKIARNGVPAKLTREVVKSWGFTGANDGSFITVLSFIGFTDNAHVPTERWRRARTDLPGAAAEGIRQGYADLYSTFPDAHDRDDQELEVFFRTHTDGNAITVGRMLRTYRSLCELASFGRGTQSNEEHRPSDSAGGGSVVDEEPPSRITRQVVSEGSAVTVNLNIQLQLPADATAETFDKFFASMKTHLMS